MAKTKTALAQKPETSSTELAKPEETGLTNWEAQMEADAMAAKGKMAGVGGGLFFSIAGGQLKLGDNPIPNNEVAVIVLAFTNAKAYYDKQYIPGKPASPKCYAYGDDADTMAPHDESEVKQSESCKGCKWNVFGTAAVGRGKACRDSAKLAVISAGTMVNGVFHPFEELDPFRKGEVAVLSVPPTSLAAWANYVRALAGVQKRPPYGAVTKIRVASHAIKQVEVTFDCLGMVPNNVMPIVAGRSKTAEAGLATPFPKLEDQQQAAKPAGKGTKGKW
jgi:hypothetical protein